MLSLRYIYKFEGAIMEILIPLAGISVGIIVPLAVFFWLYHETKHKNETILDNKEIIIINSFLVAS